MNLASAQISKRKAGLAMTARVVVSIGRVYAGRVK